MAAIGLLVNDRVLKDEYANWWTGKLSDIFGVFLLPFILAWLCEAAGCAATRRPILCGRELVLGAVLVTACGFTAVKCIVPMANAYGWALGMIRMPVKAILAVWDGRSAEFASVSIVHDPTDTLALCALIPACWVAGEVVKRRRQRSVEA